jgi:lysophospholipase L1-like esterase
MTVYLFNSCSKNESYQYIFIGDSLMSNYDTGKFFPNLRIKNKGVSGYKIEDCRKLNLNCESYDAAVLLVGTNNLSSKSDSFNEDFVHSFVDKYIDLVNSLNAKKVIVISILPRNNFDFSNIQWLNQSLADTLSNENNVIFLDVFDVFKKDNKLNPEYTMDGLHLSYLGYLLLTEHLSKVL